jgi:type II secretory pathway pseudopilin PulG
MDKNADADATYWQIECAAASERAERAEAEAAALRAELDALKAAQGWQPDTVRPQETGRYLTYNGRAFDIHTWDGRWHDSAYGRWPVCWRPLPPAPDEVQP